MPPPAARIACVVGVRPDAALSLTWSHGPDAFQPVLLDADSAAALRAATAAVRDRLGRLVAAEHAGWENVPDLSYDLAAAGYELFERLFPQSGDPRSEDRLVLDWLDTLAVESLEFVADDAAPAIPWNLVYAADPDEAAFRGGDKSGPHWGHFWGLKYNLAGGLRVDPRRRAALPAAPSVLFVVQREVFDGLLHNSDEGVRKKAAELESLRGRPGVEWVSSRAELQARLKKGRPDVLYWLGHSNTEPRALMLGGEGVTPRELRDWLEAKGGRPPGGLVFLNACSTTAAKSGGSFLAAVLKARMGGAVATEEAVLDTFANDVGLEFLAAFLDGKPVGEVMRAVRGRVPFGLLYGVYCPPELRLGPAVAPAVRATLPVRARHSG